ncbi:hypothetical protein IAT38_007466 [Cryptococcus sp. DSM 104549]
MARPSSVRLSRLSTIGWIGLGAMGRPMALNLFTKTFIAHQQPGSSSELPSFLFCEQDDSRADSFLQDLKERGGSELATRVARVGHGREMASGASRIITMLPSTPQVQAVYLDPAAGILSGLQELPVDTPSLRVDVSATSSGDGASGTEKLSSSTTLSSGAEATTPVTGTPGTPLSAPPPPTATAPHTLLIDQTTLDPTVAIDIANTIHSSTSHRTLMLDAPVSGGTVAATSGQLTIMFGSPSDSATALALPLLQTMARDGGVIKCGGNGAGVGVKVCNNLILAINQIALAEGLLLGKLLNIDPVLLHSVVNTSSGQSWSSRVNAPIAELPGTPGSRNYSGGFQSRLMLKDVGLALSAAHANDLPIPMTWAAKSIYEAVCREGEGELAVKDFSVVYEWLKQKQSEGVERGWKADPTET